MKLRWLAADLEEWQARPIKPVLVLVGARQVGKTTLARRLAGAGFEYLSFDDPIRRSELSQVASVTFARRFPRAILDEVQKVPELVEVVKAIVDAGGAERYLLLGSSHILLLDRVWESLVGRTRLRYLWPLALSEALIDSRTVDRGPAPAPRLLDVLDRGVAALEDLPENLSFAPRGDEIEAVRDRLLRIGGMPGLWESSLTDAEIREELETYVTLYLERDLTDLVRLRDLEPFVRLQRLAAERTGTLLSLSELARDAGLSPATTKSYLRYLELSFQILLLPPFFSNPSKRLVRSPRLHWVDVGVWRAVTRRWEGVPGELYESAIVAETFKILRSFRLDWEPFHLRTYDRREIDLLLVRAGRVVPVEMKSRDSVTRRDARHLRDVEETTGLRCDFGLVVYRGREVVRLDEKIWAIPDVLLFGPTDPE